MTYKQPNTAAEALEQWREANKHVGDDGGLGPEDMQMYSHWVVALAKKEGIPLEQLVPQADLRQVIEAEAGEFDKSQQEFEDFLAEDDRSVHETEETEEQFRRRLLLNDRGDPTEGW